MKWKFKFPIVILFLSLWFIPVVNVLTQGTDDGYREVPCTDPLKGVPQKVQPTSQDRIDSGVIKSSQATSQDRIDSGVIKSSIEGDSPERLLDRLVIFVRNRELAAFIGNNFTPRIGVNSFGNFLKTSIPLGADWKPGTWHHIAVRWTNGGYGRVYLDGKPSPIPYLTRFIPTSGNGIFIGTNRFGRNASNGYPLTADATISSIRIYSNPNVLPWDGFTPPDRYSPSENSQYTATMMSFNFPDILKERTRLAGRIGVISWTERIPESGGDVVFSIQVGGKTIKSDIGKDISECQCTNEFGNVINYKDKLSCWAKTAASVINYPVDFDKESNKEIKYSLNIELPKTVPVLETPVVQRVYITWIGQAKIISSWFEPTSR